MNNIYANSGKGVQHGYQDGHESFYASAKGAYHQKGDSSGKGEGKGESARKGSWQGSQHGKPSAPFDLAWSQYPEELQGASVVNGVPLEQQRPDQVGPMPWQVCDWGRNRMMASDEEYYSTMENVPHLAMPEENAPIPMHERPNTQPVAQPQHSSMQPSGEPALRTYLAPEVCVDMKRAQAYYADPLVNAQMDNALDFRAVTRARREAEQAAAQQAAAVQAQQAAQRRTYIEIMGPEAAEASACDPAMDPRAGMYLGPGKGMPMEYGAAMYAAPSKGMSEDYVASMHPMSGKGGGSFKGYSEGISHGKGFGLAKGIPEGSSGLQPQQAAELSAQLGAVITRMQGKGKSAGPDEFAGDLRELQARYNAALNAKGSR